MRARTVRGVLFVVLIAAGAGAGVLTWDAQRRVTRLHQAERDADGRLDALIDLTAQVATAQHAAVAGQPDGPPAERFSSLVQALSDGIVALRPLMHSTDAPDTLQQVAERTASLVDIDARAREQMRAGETLVATNLIFADGRRTVDSIATPLRDLREAEQAAFDRERAAILGQSWMTLGGTALLWLIGLAALVRVPTSRPATTPPPQDVAPPATNTT